VDLNRIYGKHSLQLEITNFGADHNHI